MIYATSKVNQVMIKFEKIEAIRFRSLYADRDYDSCFASWLRDHNVIHNTFRFNIGGLLDGRSCRFMMHENDPVDATVQALRELLAKPVKQLKASLKAS